MPDLIAAEQFEKRLLRGVFSQAMLGALLHRITACVGAASITWATVVLMGGFASEVAMADFVQVTFLVLEIACLLGLALLSSKLVTKRSLCRGSLDPVFLSYNDKRLNIITIIQIVSIFVQFVVFILPCALISFSSLRREEFKAIHIQTLLFPWRRQELGSGSGFATSNSTEIISDLQACLQECAGSASASNITIGDISSCVKACFPEPVAMVSNLQVCLYTFFCLVLWTCILATLCLGYVAAECSLLRKPDLSLKKYHDEVMSRALNVGLVEADEFDTWEFFFKGLAEDLAVRNIGPLEVKRQNSEFITYCYNHPKGVEMVTEGLGSADPMRQQMAASIVGFWARRLAVKKTGPLLRKLAEKMGLMGKTAEAAVNSFSALAVEWRDREECPLLEIQVAGDGGMSCNVVERVVHLVLRTRLSSLQVYARLLDHLFMSRSVCQWLASNQSQDLEAMKAKLLSIANQEVDVPRRPESRPGEVNANIDPTIKARTAFYALSAWVRIMEFENAARGNAASSNNPHGTTDHTSILNVTSNHSQEVSQNGTHPVNNGVVSEASTGMASAGNDDHHDVVNGECNASDNFQEVSSQSSSNHCNRGVISDASTGVADQNDLVNGASASNNSQEVCQSTSNSGVLSDKASTCSTSAGNGGDLQHNDGALTNYSQSPTDHVDVINGSSSATRLAAASAGDMQMNGRTGRDWWPQARQLLERLDGRLQHQEFMWYTDAARYQELLGELFPGNRSLGIWLENCEIRGREYENMP